jgi:hypothetical protein
MLKTHDSVGRFETPSTSTFRRISLHSSISLRTLLPSSPATALRNPQKPNRANRHCQVLSFSTLATRRPGAAVFEARLHASMTPDIVTSSV